ncbi:tripartite tricarboxylate transporter TctB family protein [Amorphus sp. 3PC139-8]|uniref:tripartite tricarboxylate transporter TctB family protein n=1 Tax=Amorphus sp. 3PC139-8 TaxID=2735676 RepID=UPI00345C6D92
MTTGPETSNDTERRLTAAHHPAELVYGAAAFLFAVALLTQIPNEITWVKRAALVSQPGFWPVISIVGMLIFGAAELVFAIRRNRAADLPAIRSELLAWLRALEFLVWFIAYVALVPLAGYLPTTLAFACLLTWRLGYRSARMIAAAALLAIVTVVVFKGLLSVRIPGGAVYELLPPAIRNFMILYL